MSDRKGDSVEVGSNSPVDSESGNVGELTSDAIQLASLGHKEELGESALSSPQCEHIVIIQ